MSTYIAPAEDSTQNATSLQPQTVQCNTLVPYRLPLLSCNRNIHRSSDPLQPSAMCKHYQCPRKLAKVHAIVIKFLPSYTVYDKAIFIITWHLVHVHMRQNGKNWDTFNIHSSLFIYRHGQNFPQRGLHWYVRTMASWIWNFTLWTSVITKNTQQQTYDYETVTKACTRLLHSNLQSTLWANTCTAQQIQLISEQQHQLSQHVIN